MGKNPSAMQIDLGLISGLARSPGDGLSTHSSILAWEIPRTDELGGPQSIGWQKESDTTEKLNDNLISPI